MGVREAGESKWADILHEELCSTCPAVIRGEQLVNINNVDSDELYLGNACPVFGTAS